MIPVTVLSGKSRHLWPLVLDGVSGISTITPRFVVIPGTEGMEAYKDYAYHFRASMVGTILSVAAGLVIAGIVTLL